jgi:hypothetical protein
MSYTAKLNKYTVSFKLRDGSWHSWHRFGKSMEKCLALAKTAIEREHAEEWKGTVLIRRGWWVECVV